MSQCNVEIGKQYFIAGTDRVVTAIQLNGEQIRVVDFHVSNNKKRHVTDRPIRKLFVASHELIPVPRDFPIGWEHNS